MATALLLQTLVLAACSRGAAEATWLHGTWAHYAGNEEKTGNTKDGWIFEPDGTAKYIMVNSMKVMRQCTYRVESDNTVYVDCPGAPTSVYRQHKGPRMLVQKGIGSVWHRE